MSRQSTTTVQYSQRRWWAQDGIHAAAAMLRTTRSQAAIRSQWPPIAVAVLARASCPVGDWRKRTRPRSQPAWLHTNMIHTK